MKKLGALLVLVLMGYGIHAQESGMIDQTWSLRYLSIDGETSYAPVDENLTLEFSENSNIYTAMGNGVQNGFMGTVTFDATNDTFEFQDFTVTLLDCTGSNCDYENLYFYNFLTSETGDLKEFSYNYIVYSTGEKALHLVDQAGNVARYSDHPLNGPEDYLFQTWYLHSVEADLGETLYIADFDPPVSPSLIINPDLTFSGMGFCNTFSGIFVYTEDYFNDFYLLSEVDNFEATDDPCEHDGFEDEYFYHFMIGELLTCWGGENPSTGAAFFSFEFNPGFTYNFENSPVLAIPDNSTSIFLLYPNPTSGILMIESPSITIEKLSVVDIHGKTVLKNSPTLKEIDVSSLQTGMYFVRIKSSTGNTIKKFIKK